MILVYGVLFIREIGLEPTHLSIHAPKARLATNYSTHVIYIYLYTFIVIITTNSYHIPRKIRNL